MLVSRRILKYLNGISEGLPEMPTGIEVLFPFGEKEVKRIVHEFYHKFYSDSIQRTLILGINPGRHGAGRTGIPFTDSKNLKALCGISTTINSYEPSSEFVYYMISQYGGVIPFYRDFFISSVSPVGFIQNGKNFNYYDDTSFAKLLQEYIAFQMKNLLLLPLQKSKVICLGEGKNYQHLLKLNAVYGWFEEIIALPHPRFIMQYKRREADHYADQYIRVLRSACIR